MGNPMADHFLSFMVFIFKALFLKTLKFQLCHYSSLRRVDDFSWNKKQIVHNLCSYGCKSCNFKVLMCKYFFHAKNSKNSKKMKKMIAKKSVFGVKQIFTHQNLKIATLRFITT